MKDDPLRKEIEQELRRLRTQPGELDLERMATSETLTDVVGRGSVERAFTALMDALDRYGADLGSDVRAYFETCGIGLPGDTLNQRLDAYEAVHFVDRRTGLRRSDRGANKLSYILRDTLTVERPWGKLAVSEVDGLVTVGVMIDIPHGAQWRTPHVHINGERVEREFELHDSETSEFFATAKERFDNIPLREAKETGGELFEVRVFWIMPVWPIWVASASLKTPGLTSSLITERNSGAAVSLWK